MKKIIVQVGSSQFSNNPSKTWDYGREEYVEYGIILCPDDMETVFFDGDQLIEMANNEENGVSWSDEVPTYEEIKEEGF